MEWSLRLYNVLFLLSTAIQAVDWFVIWERQENDGPTSSWPNSNHEGPLTAYAVANSRIYDEWTTMMPLFSEVAYCNLCHRGSAVPFHTILDPWPSLERILKGFRLHPAFVRKKNDRDLFIATLMVGSCLAQLSKHSEFSLFIGIVGESNGASCEKKKKKENGESFSCMKDTSQTLLKG